MLRSRKSPGYSRRTRRYSLSPTLAEIPYGYLFKLGQEFFATDESYSILLFSWGISAAASSLVMMLLSSEGLQHVSITFQVLVTLYMYTEAEMIVRRWAYLLVMLLLETLGRNPSTSEINKIKVSCLLPIEEDYQVPQQLRNHYSLVRSRDDPFYKQDAMVLFECYIFGSEKKSKYYRTIATIMYYPLLFSLLYFGYWLSKVLPPISSFIPFAIFFFNVLLSLHALIDYARKIKF